MNRIRKASERIAEHIDKNVHYLTEKQIADVVEIGIRNIIKELNLESVILSVEEKEVKDAMAKILSVIRKLEVKRDITGRQIIPCTESQVYTKRLKRYGMSRDLWEKAIELLLNSDGGLYKNMSGRKDGNGGRNTVEFNTYKEEFRPLVGGEL